MADKSGPGAGAAGANAPGQNKRLQQTQAQVDEVVDIMRMNVDKVLERDQKLSQLDDRADALQMGASQFEQSAGALKRKFWWKNLKMWIILSIVVTLLLVGIIIWVVNSTKSNQPPQYQYPPIVNTQPPASQVPAAGRR